MKSWYIVKKKDGDRWTAYKVTQEDVDGLPDDYEWRGPFKNFVQVMIAANE